jgi:hypothetical protein
VDQFLDTGARDLDAVCSDNTIQAESGLGFRDGDGVFWGIGHEESLAQCC